jgi:hypothetical protein
VCSCSWSFSTECVGEAKNKFFYFFTHFLIKMLNFHIKKPFFTGCAKKWNFVIFGARKFIFLGVNLCGESIAYIPDP